MPFSLFTRLRAWLQSFIPQDPHLTEEDFQQILQGAASKEQNARYSYHLDECQQCYNHLRTLAITEKHLPPDTDADFDLLDHLIG